MPLTTRTRLGPYEVLSPLGAGGTGEVYRRLRLLGNRAENFPNRSRVPENAPRSGSRGAHLSLQRRRSLCDRRCNFSNPEPRRLRTPRTWARPLAARPTLRNFLSESSETLFRRELI
jgi:hypothetical protein